MNKKIQLNKEQLNKVTGGESQAYAGGICGEAKQSDLTIEDCNNVFEKKDNETGNYAGGICGNTQDTDLTIKDCNNIVDINNNSSSGGIGGIVGDTKIKI